MSYELKLPTFLVLYRCGGPEPTCEALFRRIEDAADFVRKYRPLTEAELLTVESVGDDGASVHAAITAPTMRMVITDDGPVAMPIDVARAYDPSSCSCCDGKEADDE